LDGTAAVVDVPFSAAEELGPVFVEFIEADEGTV
jgi:hypothetical protein